VLLLSGRRLERPVVSIQRLAVAAKSARRMTRSAYAGSAQQQRPPIAVGGLDDG
jgi:hypothetical protein